MPYEYLYVKSSIVGNQLRSGGAAVAGRTRARRGEGRREEGKEKSSKKKRMTTASITLELNEAADTYVIMPCATHIPPALWRHVADGKGRCAKSVTPV